MRRIILALLLLTACGLGAARTPQEIYPASYIAFEMEQLSFELSDSLMIFDGLFSFSNLSALREKDEIYFPIIVDNDQAMYDSLFVTWEETGYPVPTRRLEGGFWFTLELPGRSIDTIRIRYRQKLNGKQAKYILLSANSWAKALAYASYRVSLPQGSKVKHYPFEDRVEAQLIDGRLVWTWHVHDFVPKKDFYIEWE